MVLEQLLKRIAKVKSHLPTVAQRAQDILNTGGGISSRVNRSLIAARILGYHQGMEDALSALEGRDFEEWKYHIEDLVKRNKEA